MGVSALKCSKCGGDLNVTTEDIAAGICTCEYCDSTIIIPKNLEKKENLFNKATFHRQNNEFDKAIATYEDILKEDISDGDAHWGLALSKFGIEYVFEEKTREQIPTCHRVQTESILSDSNYLAAVKYSDSIRKRVIEKDAKRIYEIQKKILVLSEKEPPYDIFICYKESDELGKRTEDSILAQELYYELVKMKYKVFFSRKTLENKLGTEYEPIIFSALSSARVMIVLGTKPKHFNAVWVRNEWSRFNKMAKVENNKVIIPAYRNMSPYELPEELSHFQSQDMSKIGFMQDLTDGIERCLRVEKKTESTEAGMIVPGMMPLEKLIQNGQTYLKLDNFAAAREVYETVTKDYPEDYRGWWGFMVCATCDFTKIVIDQSMLNRWFKYVKRLAEPEKFAEMEKIYIEYTQKISHAAAAEDMRSVSEKIAAYEMQIESVEHTIQDRTKKYQEQVLEVDKAIALHKQTRKQYIEKVVASKKRLLIGGIIMMISTIVFLIAICVMFAQGEYWQGHFYYTDGSADVGIFVLFFLCPVLFALGLVIALNKKKYGSLKMNQGVVSDIKMRLPAIANQKVDLKGALEKEVADLNTQITVIENKISICKKYLSLGEDNILTFFFSVRCAAFGVQKDYDPVIKEYREAAIELE